jgi:hypothetical protein
MKYTEPNLKILFKDLKKLILKEKKVSYSKLEKYVNERLDRIEGGSDAKLGFKKSTFYHRMNNPESRIIDRITKEAFDLIIGYLKQLFPDYLERHGDDISELVYPAFSNFLPVSSHQLEEAKTILPGYYRTYRPSIGMPGKVIAGLLHIAYNPDHDAIEVSELMMYRRDHDEAGMTRQRFVGLIWKVEREYYLAVTHDDNTKLPQALILRCIQNSATKVLVLTGTYNGITYKIGGSRIFCSKFYAERLKANPGDPGWIAALKKSSGYKRRESLSESVLAHIDPDHNNNLVFL